VNDDLRATCVGLLQDVAPEIDPGSIDGAEPLQEQLDLDSMDLLTFYTAVHDETGVDIPEADYARVASLDDLVAYVAARRS
jgi:acyl carrier protein